MYNIEVLLLFQIYHLWLLFFHLFLVHMIVFRSSSQFLTWLVLALPYPPLLLFQWADGCCMRGLLLWPGSVPAAFSITAQYSGEETCLYCHKPLPASRNCGSSFLSRCVNVLPKRKMNHEDGHIYLMLSTSKNFCERWIEIRRQSLNKLGAFVNDTLDLYKLQALNIRHIMMAMQKWILIFSYSLWRHLVLQKAAVL